MRPHSPSPLCQLPNSLYPLCPTLRPPPSISLSTPFCLTLHPLPHSPSPCLTLHPLLCPTLNPPFLTLNPPASALQPPPMPHSPPPPLPHPPSASLSNLHHPPAPPPPPLPHSPISITPLSHSPPPSASLFNPLPHSPSPCLTLHPPPLPHSQRPSASLSTLHASALQPPSFCFTLQPPFPLCFTPPPSVSLSTPLCLP